MSKETPEIPNRDEEFNQLAEQLATKSELETASQEYEQARGVFFDRFERYVLRAMQGDQVAAEEVVSSYDYQVLMTDPTIDLVRAFATDAKDEADLIESITSYFVSESQGLVGDMNATTSNQLTEEQLAELGQTADDFGNEYLKSQLDDDDDELAQDVRLTNTIIHLQGQTVNKFLITLNSSDDNQ